MTLPRMLPPSRFGQPLLLSGWYLKNVDRRRNDGTRHLKRRHRRLRAEEQERQLQGSLESIFGRKFTGRMERLILVLICLVLGLMIAEWTMPLSEETVYWLANRRCRGVCGLPDRIRPQADISQRPQSLVCPTLLRRLCSLNSIRPVNRRNGKFRRRHACRPRSPLRTSPQVRSLCPNS